MIIVSHPPLKQERRYIRIYAFTKFVIVRDYHISSVKHFITWH